MDLITEYKNAGYPANEKFYTLLRKKGFKVTRTDVDNFLNKQVTAQLHKQTLPAKQQGHFVSMKHEYWQADIIFMEYFAKKNSGYKYFLLVVDVFTRKARAVPLKTKTTEEITNAFKEIIGFMPQTPNVLLTDNGSEFISDTFNKMLNKLDIFHETALVGDHHALGIIDALTKNIKNRIFRYFTAENTTNWIDVLDKIIESYNDSPHSSLNNYAPSEALNHEQVITQLNILKKTSMPNPFNVGDWVITKTKQSKFDRGYTQKWNTQKFQVKNLIGNKCELSNGKTYLSSNLQKVNQDFDTRVSEVTKQTKIAKQARKLQKDTGIPLDTHIENIERVRKNIPVIVPKHLEAAQQKRGRVPKKRFDIEGYGIIGKFM